MDTHEYFTQQQVSHEWENTGGGTMCVVIPDGQGRVYVLSEDTDPDDVLVNVYAAGDWYGDNEYSAEPTDEHWFDSLAEAAVFLRAIQY